jgi:hypothetical protein
VSFGRHLESATELVAAADQFGGGSERLALWVAHVEPEFPANALGRDRNSYAQQCHERKRRTPYCLANDQQNPRLR